MNHFNIHKEITIYASPETVFDALTQSGQIVRYFPLKEVISEWRPGEEVLYKGEVEGVPFTDHGIIQTLVRPHQYSYQYWSDNHGTERLPENYLTITYTLSLTDNGTLLKLEQCNIPTESLYKLMDEGVWDYLLNELKQYIEGPSA